LTDDVHLDQHLCFELHAASRAFTRAYQPLLAPLDLTYPQYLVMLALWDHDGATVTELGDRLSLDSGTLTPLLKRLEQRGVLSRTRDPEDERRVRVYLTREGLGLRTKAKKVMPALAAKAGFDLSEPSDLKRYVTLRDHLRALTKLLDAA
jgi:DNA-binding MarR family transcriptional regulator